MADKKTTEETPADPETPATGDPVADLAGESTTPEQIEEIRKITPGAASRIEAGRRSAAEASE